MLLPMCCLPCACLLAPVLQAPALYCTKTPATCLHACHACACLLPRPFATCLLPAHHLSLSPLYLSLSSLWILLPNTYLLYTNLLLSREISYTLSVFWFLPALPISPSAIPVAIYILFSFHVPLPSHPIYLNTGPLPPSRLALPCAPCPSLPAPSPAFLLPFTCALPLPVCPRFASYALPYSWDTYACLPCHNLLPSCLPTCPLYAMPASPVCVHALLPACTCACHCPAFPFLSLPLYALPYLPPSLL